MVSCLFYYQRARLAIAWTPCEVEPSEGEMTIYSMVRRDVVT